MDYEGPRQSLLSCVRKRRYVTVAYAGEVRAFMERSFPATRFNVYFCAFCRGYHVGRAGQAEQRQTTETAETRTGAEIEKEGEAPA